MKLNNVVHGNIIFDSANSLLIKVKDLIVCFYRFSLAINL